MKAEETKDQNERNCSNVAKDTIDSTILERIPFEYRNSSTEVLYETEEFTSVCPWTGLPDFGRLEISYIPGDSLVELKSLKYYLNSFRNVGILQEHTVNRILDDLVALLSPQRLNVEAWFNERGGLRTHVRAGWSRPTKSQPRQKITGHPVL